MISRVISLVVNFNPVEEEFKPFVAIFLFCFYFYFLILLKGL